MRHLAKVSVLLFLACSLAAPVFPAPKNEYFTEDEIDQIREAQALNARVPLLLKLAQRRLVFLGVMERTEEEKEKEQKAREKRQKEQRKTTDTRATADKAPIEDTAY